MPRPLNKKQLRFVELHLQMLAAGAPNATESYIRAGFRCTRNSARAAAARLLGDSRVQELLQPVREAAQVARAEQEHKIVIDDPSIALMRFSGKLKPTYFDGFVRLLKEGFPIAARQDAWGWLLTESLAAEGLRAALRTAPDIARALGRLSVGRGGPRDLAAIRDGLRAANAALSATCTTDNTGNSALPPLLRGAAAALRVDPVNLEVARRAVANNGRESQKR